MLHPQARALLDLMASKGVPPLHTLSPADARTAYKARKDLTQPAPPAVAQREDLAPGGAEGPPVRLRVVRPAGTRRDEQLPFLVFFHGGGWVIGDLDTHDTLCCELATQAHCAVVSVDYRLAPEHRFPAAVDDAVAATRWVHAHAASLGLDASRMAVGGDSAGGNLAAVVALALRDGGAADAAAYAALRLQLLIYPATDFGMETASSHALGHGYLLTRDTLAYYRGHYLGEEVTACVDDPRASPLRAPDLSGLPPAFVLTAGYDPLRDEGLAYAQRLSESGVACTQLCFERQIHGFILMGRVLEEAVDAVAVCGLRLKRSLHGEPATPQASR